MKSSRAVAWCAAAALLSTLAAGCGRPPDEAWLRFLGFRAEGSASAVTLLAGDLLDEKTLSLDAAFENASLVVGSSDSGTGILVRLARVEYRTGGGSPPVYEYPVSLYLPARDKAAENTSGTLAGVPIVPASLKEWILASGLPRHPEVRFTAVVTFRAETDDGNDLEVGGSVSVVLANAGGGAGKPTVSVDARDPSATEDPPSSGRFAVTRVGSSAGALAVSYALSGSAANGSDYQTLDGSVVIAAGSESASIAVTPIADGVAEGQETVTLTLTSAAAYQLGTVKSASVTIDD